MTTALDWVMEAKNALYSGYQDEMNQCAGALSAASGTVNVNLAYDPVGISRGAVVAIDLEEMYVWSTNVRTLSVQRGFNGTTPAAHADGSLIQVKPKFSTFRVFTTINNELRNLSSPEVGLFQMLKVVLAYSPVLHGYDFPGEVTSIYDLRYTDIGPTKERRRIQNWGFVRDSPIAEFASGQALQVYEAGAPGKPITVQYRAPFTLLTTLADDVALTGLPVTAYDIPPLGAVMRLVPPRDVRRTFTDAQAGARRMDEVPPGASSQSVSGVDKLYNGRVEAELSRLLAKYPYLQTV